MENNNQEISALLYNKSSENFINTDTTDSCDNYALTERQEYYDWIPPK